MFESVVGLPDAELAGGMKLTVWCRRVGISRRTARRWKDAGKLPGVVERNGVQFITAAGMREFFAGDGPRRRPYNLPAKPSSSADSVPGPTA